MNETYIFGEFEGEMFLFAIGQSFNDPSKLLQYISNTSYTQTATF